MRETYLDRANAIRDKLNELEQFMHVVTKFDEKEKGIPSVNVIMKKTIKVKVSLFGSRFFGLGTHQSSIEVPNEIRNDLLDLAYKRKVELEEQFKACFSI